ncbi:MAG: hypothetical protein KC733_12405, partial [Candidatus Omnitrophica bacterium]|nr:hypothetical protein [Candidatus Omnitrophota bacterium]
MLIKTLSSSPKTKKWLLTIFAWLIALSIGTYFRLYPLLHFKTPAIHNQSEQYVHNLIHQKIAQDIQKKHPNLSDKEKHALHEKLFQSVLIQDAVQLKATIKKVAIDLDTPASENRQFPYLLASDSFYYFHLTEQIHELGRFPYSIKGSKYHHTLMMAPHGHYEPFNLHPFVGYYLYQFLKIFNPDIPLMQAVSFTPLLLSAIALLAFFWVGTLLQCRLSNIFISAVFFILAPIFVKRSTLGWYDNDPYNVIFPLLIIGCIFKSLPVDSNSRRRYLYTILSFVLMWFYTYFWQGWMMFFSVIFLSGITIILYNHFILRKSKATKSLSLIFLLFTVGSFIMVALTFGPGEFLTLFNEGWKALGDFLNPQLALWPDLYISVGELRPATWDYIIEFTGGPILFFTAIISLICSIYQAAVNPEKRNPFQIIILGAFFFAALFITKGAQRFAMLCLIPESLFFMIGLEYIRIFINFIFKKIYKRPIISHDYLLTILLVGLTFFPIHHMTTTIKSLLNQIFNTAWENTLLKIKDQTPPESVINAWWPPGHFIKAIAQR